MAYIQGVVTVAALVVPLIILYKLWNTRRDRDSNNRSNIDQRHDYVVTSYVMFDSEDLENNHNYGDNNIIKRDFSDSENNNYNNTPNPSNSESLFPSSSSNIDNDNTAPQPSNSESFHPSTSTKSTNENNTPHASNSESLLPSFSSSSSSMNEFAESSNSLSLPSVEYEVFLSFRGPDTRKQFTDILYRFLVHSKIHTFRDDDELRKGEGIWPNLAKAIDQSKIYVPIISKTYAHSKWCLKELAEIVKRQKEDRRCLILPIFYMVDPRDIRHQTGPYEDAFQQYADHFDEKTIQSWKDALSDVGSLKGWHVKSNDEVGAIVDQVYADVWSYLSKDNFVIDTDELVGIDYHIQVLTEKLNLDSDEGVTMVGIHGLGGIGKTTIAKAVYNIFSYQFDRCCFLNDIRETQGQKDGIAILQKKLISDILRKESADIRDENEGRKMIKERVSRHKVLVVLDDVDENFKIEDLLGSPKDFSSGSRFIVTSRNTKILRTLIDNQWQLYEVGAMDHLRSLELFCKHAFKMNSPPSSDYKILSDKIVATTGGLPLTLKVIGSLLFREDIPVWEEKLVQLNETPEFEVMKRLKISFDTLSYEAQQIFLDIACFFIGTNKEFPCYMWSDCRYYPISNINVLVQKSLLKVGENTEFQMHDQLRDMGREIVRQENIDQPWMRSRIWSDEDALELLSNEKGQNQVKAIRLNSSSLVMDELNNNCFTGLSELRYFDAKSTTLTGDFSNLLPNLRWLRLAEHKNGNRDVANFQMKNLMVLDLQESKINDNWGVWHHIKMAKKLKVLNLEKCDSLRKLPLFPESGSLEILDLSSLELPELDISKLKKLIVLRLKRCTTRKIMGGTIGMMKKLRELDLTGFNFGCEHLREVLADIGQLSDLEILRQTEWVGIRGNHIQEQVLTGIKLPVSLKELGTSSPVPNLEELVKLEKLYVANCMHGVDIPPSSSLWWKVSKLKSLSLRKTKVNPSPSSSSLFPSSLIILEIKNCDKLVWLPTLENLEDLARFSIKDSHGSTDIHGLAGLKSLQSLELETAYRVRRIHGLEDLMSSPSNCKLQELRIHHCYDLEGEPSIQHNGIAVLGSMRVLSIFGCDSPTIGAVIRNLSKFPRLRKLELRYTKLVGHELEGLGSLEELEELVLHELWSIERITSLSKLQKLKRVEIYYLSSLREIEGLADLQSLISLSVRLCESLERLFVPTKHREQEQNPVANLKNLRWVDLRKSTKLSAEDLSALEACPSSVFVQWPEKPFSDDEFYAV